MLSVWRFYVKYVNFNDERLISIKADDLNFFLETLQEINTGLNNLFLEDAYLIFSVHPFSFKLKEQLKHPRKLYCIDNGLINAIVPANNENFGRQIENLVFLELKRRNEEIYFYAQPISL
jgi:hypothetical protein